MNILSEHQISENECCAPTLPFKAMDQNFATYFLNMIDEIVSFLKNITDVGIFVITYLVTKMSQDQETCLVGQQINKKHEGCHYEKA